MMLFYRPILNKWLTQNIFKKTMASINVNNTAEKIDDLADKSPDSNNQKESPTQKSARQIAQRTEVNAIIGSSFDEETRISMLKYAEECTPEEFIKMREGNPALEIPSLRVAAMREDLWNMEISEQERNYPGFKEKLRKKLTAEKSKSSPTDRRILMAETAWEMEYEKMEKIMPPHLKSELEKHYKRYDRGRGLNSHRIVLHDNPIPDCNAVVERMKKGVVKRMKIEYSLAAAKFEDPKAWTKEVEKLDKDLTAEEITKMYNDLEGKYWDREEQFFKERDRLKKENPAAHDFFLRLYNEHTRQKLYAKRGDVMEQAVKAVDKSMKELEKAAHAAEVKIHPSLLDPTSYETIDDIEKKINEFKKTEKTPEAKEEKTTEEIDIEALEKTIEEAEDKMFKENKRIIQLSAHKEILRRTADAKDTEKGMKQEEIRRRRAEQMNRLSRNVTKDQVRKDDERMDTKELEGRDATSSDERDSATVISLEHGLAHKQGKTELTAAKEILEETSGREGSNNASLFRIHSSATGKESDVSTLRDRSRNLDRERDTEIEKSHEETLKKAGMKDAGERKGFLARLRGKRKRQRELKAREAISNIDKLAS